MGHRELVPAGHADQLPPPVERFVRHLEKAVLVGTSHPWAVVPWKAAVLLW
eukprot:COSAG02_NODE_66498_length_255_cov_0.666667_1_plen_50_part_01